MKLRQIRKTAILLSILITALNLSGMSYCDTYEAKAATVEEINSPQVFLKQVNGDKQCTLVAATMMIRRAAMLSGNMDWINITTDKVMKQAWVEGIGLRYTFTYAGITVNRATFGPDPVMEAISLLAIHPEGIVLYDQIRTPRAHAILLTDYTEGVFYSADPAEASPAGRIPNTLSSIKVEDGEYYWYVSSPVIPSPSPSETTSIINVPTVDINIFNPILSQTSFSFDGTEKRPLVSIEGLTEQVDFTTAYYDNIYPGISSVIITGIGAYSGSVIKNFEIRPASLQDSLNEIKLDTANQTIKKGKTISIKLTVPKNLILVKDFSDDSLGIYTEAKIIYASDNKKIASVSTNGTIKGKKKGTTKIYVIVELPDTTKTIFSLKIKVI